MNLKMKSYVFISRAKGGYLGHKDGRKNYENNVGKFLVIYIFP